jgi:Predicted transcriptional regulators
MKVHELRRRRTELRPKTSQRALAQLTGLHHGTISALELGKSRPDVDTAIILAKVFRVTPDQVSQWCGGYARRGVWRDWLPRQETDRRSRSTSKQTA